MLVIILVQLSCSEIDQHKRKVVKFKSLFRINMRDYTINVLSISRLKCTKTDASVVNGMLHFVEY